MELRPIATKTLAIVLSLLTLVVTAPFSLGETLAAVPLGAIVTPGTVTVGSSAAPTGTTIFAGDRVTTSSVPALIHFNSGSRVEMTQAAATYSRHGKTLVVQAEQGLLRFSFTRGEEVQINAGRYNFTAVGGNSSHIGELGLNRNGQLALAVTEGVFASLNTVTGERTEVLPGSPLLALDQGGKGSVSKNGKTLTDASKSYQVDSLKGKCIVAGGQAYQIAGNTATVITIKGAWKLDSGSYDYKIVDCINDALVAAGATAAAASAAAAGAAAEGAAVAGAAAPGAAAGAAAAGAGAGAAAGMSTATVVAIVAGVATAVGLGIGIYEATKSSSSR